MTWNDYVPDNNFRHDSKPTRIHRLWQIETGSAEVLAMLPVPSELALWMGTCSADFSGKTSNLNAATIAVRRQTRTMKQKSTALREEYNFLKPMIASAYRTFPALLSEFDIKAPLPRGAAAMVEQVRAAKSRLEFHATLPDKPEMPPEAAATLAGLLSEYDAAKAARAEAIIVRKHAQQAYKEMWERANIFLEQLLALWMAFSPKRNVDYAWKSVGFRMPLPKRSGMPPPPENLRTENGRLLWDAADRATSYQVQTKPAGNKKAKFTEHYAGTQTECAAPVAGSIVRVRGRNVHGFGRFGAEVEG